MKVWSFDRCHAPLAQLCVRMSGWRQRLRSVFCFAQWSDCEMATGVYLENARNEISKKRYFPEYCLQFWIYWAECGLCLFWKLLVGLLFKYLSSLLVWTYAHLLHQQQYLAMCSTGLLTNFWRNTSFSFLWTWILIALFMLSRSCIGRNRFWNFGFSELSTVCKALRSSSGAPGLRFSYSVLKEEL